MSAEFIMATTGSPEPDIEQTPTGWQDYLLASGQYNLASQGLADAIAPLAKVPLLYATPGEVTNVPCSFEQTDKLLVWNRMPSDLTEGQLRDRHMNEYYWWWQWEGYTYNPFNADQTETYALGAQIPMVVLHNFGPALSQEQASQVAQAYQWFADNFEPETLVHAKRILITGALGAWHKETKPRPVFGTYEQAKAAVGLADFLVNYEPRENHATVLKRYEPILAKGVPLLEVIITHELAHALLRQGSSLQRFFEEQAGWQVRYHEGKYGLLYPVYGLSGEGLGLPVTDHANQTPLEDSAETLTFARFCPELLDPGRLHLVAKLQAYATELNEGGPRFGAPVTAMRLPKLLYPYHRVPEAILPHFIYPESLKIDETSEEEQPF